MWQQQLETARCCIMTPCQSPHFHILIEHSTPLLQASDPINVGTLRGVCAYVCVCVGMCVGMLACVSLFSVCVSVFSVSVQCLFSVCSVCVQNVCVCMYVSVCVCVCTVCTTVLPNKKQYMHACYFSHTLSHGMNRRNVNPLMCKEADCNFNNH